MVIDTSAILAWLKEEPERARIVAALEAHSARRLSAVSLLEAQIVVRGREHPALLEKLERFLDEIEVLVTPFDETQARLAADTFQRYGKGHLLQKCLHKTPENALCCSALSVRWRT